jgi:hypothetical protein
MSFPGLHHPQYIGLHIIHTPTDKLIDLLGAQRFSDEKGLGDALNPLLTFAETTLPQDGRLVKARRLRLDVTLIWGRVYLLQAHPSCPTSK